MSVLMKHGNKFIQSTLSGQLAVPHRKTNYGDRSFTVSGPAMDV